MYIPDGTAVLAAFFALEAERKAHIENLLDDAARLDASIDARVLDLYSITHATDHARILGGAPAQADDDTAANVNSAAPDGALPQEEETT